MKKVLLIIIVSLLILFICMACSVSYIFISRGQNEILSDTLSIEEEFEKINIVGFAEVELVDSTDKTISYEYTENIADQIEITIKNETLYINNRTKFSILSIFEESTLKIQVPVEKLSSLEVLGSAKIYNDQAFIDDDSSTLSDSTFEIIDLDIDLDGAGDIDLNIPDADSIDINLNGAGDVQLYGQSDTLDISLNGAGNIDAQNLITNNVTATLIGAGAIKINGNESIDASIDGVGTIEYTGDADDITTNIQGIGSIEELDTNN